jgi:hypothetical protein
MHGITGAGTRSRGPRRPSRARRRRRCTVHAVLLYDCGATGEHFHGAFEAASPSGSAPRPKREAGTWSQERWRLLSETCACTVVTRVEVYKLCVLLQQLIQYGTLYGLRATVQSGHARERREAIIQLYAGRCKREKYKSYLVSNLDVV